MMFFGFIFTSARRSRGVDNDSLVVRKINDKFDDLKEELQSNVMNEGVLKKLLKDKRKQEKKDDKLKEKKTSDDESRCFVIDFDGDIHASAVEALRMEVTSILQIAKPGDEVVIRLESEGGMVHSYGLAASQLARLKNRGITLTVSVDKVAASGGYLMACVADKILAAPFAVLGSIGVVAQIPNFNRLLKEKNIDYEVHTAGEFKRTLTMFGENTDDARSKFKEELQETHELFKQYVSENRPSLNLDKVATGEHWYGTRALELGLVDELLTSDDYLMQCTDKTSVYQVEYRRHLSLQDKIKSSWMKLQTASLPWMAGKY